MIVTVTPNTAIDHTVYISSYSPGKTIRSEWSNVSMAGKAADACWVLSELGIPDKGTQTRVDYLFFSNQTYAGCRKARWVGENWLRLQPSEIARYNLTDLNYTVC